MILLKPFIQVRRLSVFKGDFPIFDAEFHHGVNIVRGMNSSGKTTILDFLAYSLGAEFIPWKKEALLSDCSVVEVLLNDKAVTLRRVVNDRPMNPMFIFWGAYQAAIDAPFSKWEQFSFRRSAAQISFTQAILAALELPEAQGEGTSNLTMHQFLRVIYADQPSLHSPIFRTDTFDSALIRETVGSYLSGVYLDDLYSAQLSKRDIEKELQQFESELKSILSLLTRAGMGSEIDFVDLKIENLQSESSKLSEQLNLLKRERTASSPIEFGKNNENLRISLNGAQSALSDARDVVARRELEIADSQKFVEELELRIRGLDESVTTRNYFGKLAIAFCPCCLAEIKADEENKELCLLCKNPLSNSAADSQVLRMRNELRVQLHESVALNKSRQLELEKARSQIPSLRQELKALEEKYALSKQHWSSGLENALESIARRLGAIEQEITELHQSKRLGDTVRSLQEKRSAAKAKLEALNAKIDSLLYEQEILKRKVQLDIAATLGRLLRLDLQRQDEFAVAKNIQFSFTDNVIAVEGATKFSESSAVVLRHLFHVALLSASTRFPEMRFPRFLILDGIEDGGMELARSHNLQKIIVEECANFPSGYQLIFATSEIAPDFETNKYVVARAFTKQDKSLKV